MDAAIRPKFFVIVDGREWWAYRQGSQITYWTACDGGTVLKDFLRHVEQAFKEKYGEGFEPECLQFAD